ncbi:FAD-dependent oxidoreductase [Paenibacillus caseinilyticus]|uniref:FAD-dependent oxidoreductase n=1 Tax=Paenibacillus mucilaginosus TaxID=61624 RepID=UPI001F4C9120|nr:FAD-dependent oxidoreductase [Paenibacillus mucilaginosus]
MKVRREEVAAVRPLGLLMFTVLFVFAVGRGWAEAESSGSAHYDVVVTGSEPEAVAAAVAAAREGQRTLLIDTKPEVGGLFTQGELNSLDLNLTPDGKQLNKGIFEEFYGKIGRRTSFDTKRAGEVLKSMMAAEPNLTVKLSAGRIKPLAGRSKIRALEVAGPGGPEFITAGMYIDASADGDTAYAAGAPFTFGQEDFRGSRETMCATLVFELQHVDWPKVQEVQRKDGNPDTGADAYSAWGYPQMHAYRPADPGIRVRALNLGRQEDGRVLVNALQLLGVDGTDPVQVEAAMERGKRELPSIVGYLRTLPGLEQAELSRTASSLYIRETRHLIGEYRLTLEDVLENRDFPDRIAFGSYPVDIQRSRWGPDLVLGNPEQFAVPLRSLIPKGWTNLLVASRSASYDSLAHGSARVVPLGMSAAEAAGTAAAYANRKGLTLQDIAREPKMEHAARIQARLNEKGAGLAPIPPYKDETRTHWAYPGVMWLRDRAVVAGGYRNDYRLDEPAGAASLRTWAAGAALASHKREPVMPERIVSKLANDPQAKLDKAELGQFLQANGMQETRWSAPTAGHWKEDEEVTNGLLFMILTELYR